MLGWRYVRQPNLRCYVKVKVRVHRYPDGRLALFHGPRGLARFDAQGRLIPPKLQAVA